MSDLKIPGRSGGPPPKQYVLDVVDRDIIRMAMRGDVDMRRYVPEVMSLCARLDIAEPPWMAEEAIRERVERNRAEWQRQADEARRQHNSEAALRCDGGACEHRAQDRS
jgi:hypothetical protein